MAAVSCAVLHVPQRPSRVLAVGSSASSSRKQRPQRAWQAASLRPRRALAAAAAAAGGDDAAGGEPAPAQPAMQVPPAWDKAHRLSADAMAMLTLGDAVAAELILKKGLDELSAEFPGDPSAALLHTQLWNLRQEAGEYAGALAQAQAAYDLMISHFGNDSADAAFHGIRLGISLVVTNQDLDRAQELLMIGGTCAQHNLELFWGKMQELAEAGTPSEELTLNTKKLMVSLAECNFYGALGVVRRAIDTADELEVPMKDLEEAWLGGVKQMAMALPPEHAMFDVALRELARVVPDAAGRPSLQAELEAVVASIKEFLYLLKNLPDSMKQGMGAGGEGGAEGGAAAEEEFLP